MTERTAPWARFDDMIDGTATIFTDVQTELVAWQPSEVAAVLAEVDRVTSLGFWAFGFVAYEAASGLNPSLPTRNPARGIPLAWFGVCQNAVPSAAIAPPPLAANTSAAWTPIWDETRYRAAVWAARQRIAVGDTYQCNLTTQLIASGEHDAHALYARLAHAQRGSQHAFLDIGDIAIASASPELFFEWRDDQILMRPMKGTAPRGRTTAEDAEAVRTLISSEKERAENIMIVDLVRNDLAAIAENGSVRVESLCRPERYETVHQLTSDVRARLCPDTTLTDVFRALFPCGSITGAPKASTMQIINELEDGPRGIYCGAIGIVGPPSSPVRARFNVAIRTAVVDRVQHTSSYGVGGGVTWSSDPLQEHAEAMTKAAVLTTTPRNFQLIESLPCKHGKGPVRLDRHLQRLADSASYFGFKYREQRVTAAVTSALRAHTPDGGESRVRISLYRDGHVDVAVGTAPEPPAGTTTVALDYEPIDTRECWPHHKTTLRQPYDHRLAKHRTDDVLLVNERGQVTGACHANLAALIDGQWWTPPLSSGCIAGISREVLLHSRYLAERILLPSDVLKADALALINSLRGWQPASLQVDDERRLA